METDVSCPSCTGNSWMLITEREYRAADVDCLPEYDRQRYRVLFEVWRPGVVRLRIALQACSECGFVLYTPRPTAQDLSNKYRFLANLDQTANVDAPTDSRSDVWRARRLFRELKPYVRFKSRVLDFGGGDGRLMSDLLRRGCRCYLVDYCEKPVAGIERLGESLDDLRPEHRFDVVVASHVIEHVADPRGILNEITHALEPDGVIYIEVPLEIWAKPPQLTEPVTHVNFFVPGSMRRLLMNSGYTVLGLTIGFAQSAYGWGRVIRVIARSGQDIPAENFEEPLIEINRFLRPTVPMRLAQRIKTPATWMGAIRYKLSRGIHRFI